MTAKGNVSVHFDISEIGANSFAAGPFFGGAVDAAVALASGVGAGQVDLAVITERTVLTGANDDVDLSGVLTTALAVSFAAVELAGIIIFNRQKDGTVNTTTLTLGGAGTPVPGFSVAGLRLEPGGIFCAVSPGALGLATIANASADLLRITNSAGATNKYLMALLGRTA